MTWAELYRAADTRAKRTLVIRLHRRAWFAECWCWPSQHEQARQLGCSKNTVRIALRAKPADLCHKRGRIRYTQSHVTN